MQAENPFAIFWDKVQFELSIIISSEQTANQNINLALEGGVGANNS